MDDRWSRKLHFSSLTEAELSLTCNIGAIVGSRPHQSWRLRPVVTRVTLAYSLTDIDVKMEIEAMLPSVSIIWSAIPSALIG